MTCTRIFKPDDLQRLADSEALLGFELELLRRALGSGSAISVRVEDADGESFGVVSIGGAEVLSYPTC